MFSTTELEGVKRSGLSGLNGGEASDRRSPFMTWSTGMPTSLQVTAERRRWLRQLTSGATLQRLAQEERHSVRHRQHRIADLFRRLGVRSCSEAVAIAALAGMVTGDDVFTGPVEGLESILPRCVGRADEPDRGFGAAVEGTAAGSREEAIR